jgi:hypothetical protein
MYSITVVENFGCDKILSGSGCINSDRLDES